MLFSIDDKTLIAKALDGSQRSWTKLVARHERRVYNYCLRMTGDSHDAMDLMQEVFLSIYRHLPSFRGQAQFTTWMFRIAANKSIDFLRSRNRQAYTNHTSLDDDETELAMDEHYVAPEHQRPDHLYELQRHNQDIQQTLLQLKPEQRLVVELKFFQHCTFEEISYQIGIPVNTVKTRLYTALQKLKTHLEVQHVM